MGKANAFCDNHYEINLAIDHCRPRNCDDRWGRQMRLFEWVSMPWCGRELRTTSCMSTGRSTASSPSQIGAQITCPVFNPPPRRSKAPQLTLVGEWVASGVGVDLGRFFRI